MSVAEMSATLQNKIATAIESAITKNGKLGFTERNLNAHLGFASQDRIRENTNPGTAKHESIMSRGALDKLKYDLQKYTAANQISLLTSDIIEKLDFDGFVTYLRDNYFKGKESISKQRTDPNFEYTTPVKASGSKTRLIVGTSNFADEENRDLIILKNIPHGTLVNYFSEYIAEKADVNVNKAELLKEIRSLFNAGHLTGVFNARLIRAFGIKRDKKSGSLSINGSKDQELVSVIQGVLDLTSTADLLSSNIFDDPTLYLRTEKRLTDNQVELRLTTEVQFARSIAGEKANQEVGQLLSTAGRYLSNIIKAVGPNVSQRGRDTAAGKAAKGLYKSLSKIDNYIKTRVIELQKLKTGKATVDERIQRSIDMALRASGVYQSLITSGGSDPINVHIAKAVARSLGNTNINQPLGGISNATVNVALKRLVTKNKTKVTDTKNAVKQKVKTATLKLRQIYAASKSGPASQPYSLVDLQLLINTHLQDVISANMGAGGSKGLLNYRTGRFASSVKLERLTVSREGMISAFYSYMKNPYQTFDPGFAQGIPGTRSPKTLISRSIREIAATKVHNRMRTVLL